MGTPAQPKIYHICHVDRLASILADGGLWCDAEIARRKPPGTTIGMRAIKARRMTELCLASHPGLFVGSCVPFYFCPRSVMLYLIYQANQRELTYRGGQEPIIHLQADLFRTVEWADAEGQRWAFTLSNAGARYVEDRADLTQLTDLNWEAIAARRWSGTGVDPGIMEGKQAEFLIEQRFPWQLVERIGVYSQTIYRQVKAALSASGHCPPVRVQRGWYY